MTRSIEAWIDHSCMSDPAGHAPRMAGLPADIGGLGRVVQGLLIHSDWLAAYGLDEKLLPAGSRQTIAISQRLTDIIERDGRPLQTARTPDRRAIGTCRDFALMLCSMLRSNGVPARVRCGFAAYFHAAWEDHWVCEYWDRSAQTWRLSDAQIDGVQREKCHIAFDTADVPHQSFVTAGKAWLDCRSGVSDPNRFGHGQTTGTWLLQINVIRDHYVLNNRETSVWDGWRDAPASMRIVTERDAVILDELAAFPERTLVELKPGWLT